MSPMRLTLLAAALATLSACAPVAGPLYHWGPYEDLLYAMYAAPGKADPGVQVERLSRDIAEAQSKGQRVAPGVHLHLGYMYWLEGNAASARQAMEAEKRLFPESAVLVDRMLAKMGKP